MMKQKLQRPLFNKNNYGKTDQIKNNTDRMQLLKSQFRIADKKTLNRLHDLIIPSVTVVDSGVEDIHGFDWKVQISLFSICT